MKTKRFFDIFASCIGLILLLPLFIFVAFLIRIDSKGSIYYKQERIGKDFKEFKIFKFRSMMTDSGSRGPQITVGSDRRVTRIGKYLRKYKIDELPQLINVLRGEMSLVGPRPETRKYVYIYKKEYSKLLSVRPGITDPASIQYSDEENVLSLSDNWEEDYIKKVLPEKIKLSLRYVKKNTGICDDLKIIIKTLFKV